MASKKNNSTKILYLTIAPKIGVVSPITIANTKANKIEK